MKKYIIVTVAFTFIAATFSCRKMGEKSEREKLETSLLVDTTRIEFLDSTTFNFDTINEGDVVEHTFRIKNVGDKNFIVATADATCGCTVPEYPKQPIPPGGIADIKVKFNSSGKHHEQHKTVTVSCNTQNRRELLHLVGYVRAKE